MLPNLPQRRRGKPQAFARPSVDLSHHGRSWVDEHPVAKLVQNDVVAGKGSVQRIVVRDTGVSVTFPNEVLFYPVDAKVKAFVSK